MAYAIHYFMQKPYTDRQTAFQDKNQCDFIYDRSNTKYKKKKIWFFLKPEFREMSINLN